MQFYVGLEGTRARDIVALRSKIHEATFAGRIVGRNPISKCAIPPVCRKCCDVRGHCNREQEDPRRHFEKRFAAASARIN